MFFFKVIIINYRIFTKQSKFFGGEVTIGSAALSRYDKSVIFSILTKEAMVPQAPVPLKQ